MDQPQYQVLGSDEQAYRYTAYPFQKQPLHLLYPGRVMQSDWHYTGENIPNEDPIGLAKTRYQTAALARAADMEREALAKHLGGRDKVVDHLAVEPDAIIEDPVQQSLAIQTIRGLEGNLDTVSSETDNLSEVENRVYEIATNIRKGLEGGNPNPLSKEEILPKYNWRSTGDIIETYTRDDQEGVEGYTHDSNSPDSNSPDLESEVTVKKSCSGGACTKTTCDNGNKTCSYVTCDKHGDDCGPDQICNWAADCGSCNYNSNSSKMMVWIPIIVIGILAILFVILIIYGINKHSSYAEAIQPKSYNIISPEFIPPGSSIDLSGLSTYGGSYL